ncbi:ATP-binding protein [Streptomyces sp. NPDC004980]
MTTAARPPGNPPGNLPDETTSFVGRHTELARLEHALDTHRLTTLVGPGGVGKSRLAVRAARRAGALYPDGTWWADLSPLRDDTLLVATVSDAVGLADHSLRMPVETLCEWLVDKRLLLVLDSCEHLRTPCGHLLGEILTTSPGLTVLATSRQPLGLGWERIVDVPPLPAEGEDGALALFRERVHAAAPGTTLRTPDEAAAAAEICRRLEGIPLAVELAAAGTAQHTVGQIAERLGSRLEGTSRFEGTSRLDVLNDDSQWPRRHRALRTTIGWSHELCTPLERLLWARLTVLRGGFDTATAREVCAGGPLTTEGVDEALRGLAAKSVVKRDGERHRMLDTLREYGRMWLAELGEGEERAAADRHAASFLGLARRAHTGWTGPDQVSWYHRIADTHLDLCAALDHLLAHDVGAAQEMAGRVGFFWSCCGYLSEARRYARRALDAAPAEERHRTRLRWVLGVAALLQGDFRTADELGALCTKAADHEDDDEGMLGAAYLGGLTLLMTGRAREALDTAERVLRRTEAASVAPAYRLRCHLISVFALTELGRLTEAARGAAVLRSACESRGEHWTRSYADYQLALIALLQGRARASVAHARSMLAGKHLLRDSFGIALGLDVLAAGLAAQGEGIRAARVYGTGHVYWRMVGHPQRGTPELGPVREACERRARALAGDAAYQRAFERGQADTAEAGLASALDAGPCG